MIEANAMGDRILVIEDDEQLGRQIVQHLRGAGFDPLWWTEGRVPDAELASLELVILDLMLPGTYGMDILKAVRAVSEVPVLVLSARNATDDKVRALRLGADDYMTKPFSMRELVARLRVLLRRVERAAEAHAPAPTVAVNGLRIDGAQRRVWAGDAEVHLTPTEFDLLACLAARPGTVLSREALLAEVWGWADASGTRTVDSHVKSLRRKLGADRVRTVHGVGYALEPGA